jgi:hypothetical protein
MIASSVFLAWVRIPFLKSTQLRFLKGKSPLKLGVICDFSLNPSFWGVLPHPPPLGAWRRPQTPRSALAFRWDAYTQPADISVAI